MSMDFYMRRGSRTEGLLFSALPYMIIAAGTYYSGDNNRSILQIIYIFLKIFVTQPKKTCLIR